MKYGCYMETGNNYFSILVPVKNPFHKIRITKCWIPATVITTRKFNIFNLSTKFLQCPVSLP